MAKFFQESDVETSFILSQKVGVLGFGSQGMAQAQNLRDQGVEVRIGLPHTSKTRNLTEELHFVAQSTSEITRWADLLVFCTPDVPMGTIYSEEVEPHLRPGQTLLFAHGFNILYQRILPPQNVDVVMVSPKGPGPGLRSEFLAGRGLPALLAVHQDFSGNAWSTAIAYAWGIGSSKSVMMETTFREETETDLFGEQAVLCGGIPELVMAGFETLVAAGYQPEAAYFECLHETKLIVDLLVTQGLAGMRQKISDTAEWGGYVAGPEVVNASSRVAMQQALERIQSGQFAEEWIKENEKSERLRKYRSRSHLADEIGADLRRRMGLG